MSTWLNAGVTAIGVIFGGILIFAFVDWLDSTKFMNSIRDYVNKNRSEGAPETSEFLTNEALLFYFGFLYLYVIGKLGIFS